MKKRLENLTLERARAQAFAWLRERIDLDPLVGQMAKKTVPMHRCSWIYLLGGAALFLFVLQVASGCLLMLYYQPTEDAAHQSVHRIMTEVPYGWLMRSMHVWGANLFITFTGLHFLSVLFNKTYRKPRELTWVCGLLMFLLALGFGFSGYLLPWNELAYNATLVGTELPASLPVVGELAVQFLRGGQLVSGDTLTRFYAGHVVLIPLAFTLLLLIHLALIQAQGMSLPLGMSPKRVRDQRPFFSEFLLIDAGIWLVLFGAIVTLAVFLPAAVGLKADPLLPTPEGIKPEWYFLFMFKTLKLVPETLAVAFFGLMTALLLLIPFLDRNASREKKSPLFTALFLVLLSYATVFEILAWIAPGVEHTLEPLVAPTYSLSRGAVSLVFLWSAIGFLLYYLRALLRENTRIRKLREDRPAE